jgi:hypothetical protein
MAEVLWRVQLVALGDGEAEIIRVAIPGDPSVWQGEMVRVEGMTAQAWEMEGRNGMAFRATAIQSLSGRGELSGLPALLRAPVRRARSGGAAQRGGRDPQGVP